MPEQCFSERVKAIVGLVGSAEKLARLAGMSARIIGKYLAGESDPTREKLVALANAAKVNIAWLADGEGPMMKDNSQANVNYGKLGIQGTVSGDNPIGISEGGGAITSNYSDDVRELADLLEEYTSKAYRKKLLQELSEYKSKNGGI